MISSDAQYSSNAEVHVPQACAVAADYMKGCLFPTALNFDPTAVQSGVCAWPTKGCMDQTAYNYNALATSSGPCIAKVAGCSIYQRMYTGMPTADKFVMGGPYSDKFQHFEGQHSLDLLPLGIWDTTTTYNKSTVYNYSADATDPADCIVVVEGCTDSTAANYDSMATVDSGDWCEAYLAGCMDPLQSSNFASANTVNSACIGKVLGCTEPAAVNYNERATFNDGTCKAVVSGCGHPMSSNYDSDVTTHDANECVWYLSPPPSPPAPPLNPGGTSQVYSTVKAEFSFNAGAGSASAAGTKPGFTVADDAATAICDAAAGCVSKTYETSVTSGSTRRRLATGDQVLLTISLRFASAADASAAVAGLNAGSLTSSIDWGTLGTPTIVAVLGADVTVAFSPFNYPPSPPPGAIDSALVGGLVGGIGGLLLLLIILGVFYYKRVRVKRVKRSSVQPGE